MGIMLSHWLPVGIRLCPTPLVANLTAVVGLIGASLALGTPSRLIAGISGWFTRGSSPIPAGLAGEGCDWEVNAFAVEGC